MTPSLNGQESNSTFEKSLSSSSPTSSTTYISETIHNDRLVIGPDGNHILCDSPNPSQPPPYSGPDDISPVEPRRPSSSLNKRSSTGASNRHSSSATSERSKPKRVIGNYTLTNTLGSGSMGKVRLAVNNFTGDKLAVKIVPRRLKDTGKSSKKKEKDEHREVRTIREASIMLLLHHPFIASLKEMIILDPYYYLFMEYVNGGQLLDYIISHGKLKEKQARRFARQILSALDYCHRNSIVHRDLKIENILISQSGNIKIIDFGLSNLFSPRSSLSTFCGSLYFAAPELLNAKAYTGPEVDVWSFGVVLYVLVCGKVPFDDQNMPALHEKIKRGVVDYPSHLSTDCKSVLSRMLVTNPTHRATISEITIHPWMNKGYDGPVDNYVPDRLPLSLPIDMEVVRGMTGFEFGSETEIRDKLQKIITSDEYQKAAKVLAERTADIHRNHNRSTSRFSPHYTISSAKSSFILPNEDPQSIPAAYHPLVSIYYLVKERIEREKRLALKAEEEAAAALMQDRNENLSTVISLPENVHPSDHVLEQSLFGEPGEVFGKKENGLSRLFSRSSAHRDGRRRSEQSNQSSEFSGGNEEEYELHRSPSNSNNVLRRLSLALSRVSTERGPRSRKSSATEANNVSTSTSTPIQISSRDHHNHHNHISKSYATDTSRFPNSLYDPASTSSPPPPPRKNDLQQSDIELATAAAAAAVAASTSNSNNNTFGNKISKMLPRRMTLGQSSINAENHSNFLHMVHGNHHTSNENRVLASTKAPIKKLPSTTAYHNDNKADLQQQQHDHEQSFPSAADGSTLFQQKGTADENIKPVFIKGLFSVTTTSTKHPAVIRADLIRVLERIGVKWRESKGRFECVHMPSIDLNKVVLNDDEDQNHITTDELPQPPFSSDAAVNAPVVPLPDLVVRFEIYIVKVPWLLGMHGLQFRRVGGDPWQYKNMCSKILAELKL